MEKKLIKPEPTETPNSWAHLLQALYVGDQDIEWLCNQIYRGDRVEYHVAGGPESPYTSAIDAVDASLAVDPPLEASVMIGTQVKLISPHALQYLAVKEVERGTLRFAMPGLAYLPITRQK